MRLTILFLLLTLVAVYGIDRATTPSNDSSMLRWPDRVYVRQEGKFCPLYFPAEQLR